MFGDATNPEKEFARDEIKLAILFPFLLTHLHLRLKTKI